MTHRNSSGLRLTSLIAFVFLFSLNPAQAENKAAVSEVVKFKAAGANEDKIVALIKSKNLNYGLVSAEVISLHERGIPDSVLSAMLDSGKNIVAPVNALQPSAHVRPQVAPPPKTVSSPPAAPPAGIAFRGTPIKQIPNSNTPSVRGVLAAPGNAASQSSGSILTTLVRPHLSSTVPSGPNQESDSERAEVGNSVASSPDEGLNGGRPSLPEIPTAPVASALPNPDEVVRPTTDERPRAPLATATNTSESLSSPGAARKANTYHFPNNILSKTGPHGWIDWVYLVVGIISLFFGLVLGIRLLLVYLFHRAFERSIKLIFSKTKHGLLTERTPFIRWFYPNLERLKFRCPVCNTLNTSTSIVCTKDHVILLGDHLSKKKLRHLLNLLRFVLVSAFTALIYRHMVWPLNITVSLFLGLFFASFIRKYNPLLWSLGAGYIVGVTFNGAGTLLRKPAVTDEVVYGWAAVFFLCALPILMIGFTWRLKLERADPVRWPYIYAAIAVVAAAALWAAQEILNLWLAWKLSEESKTSPLIGAVFLAASAVMTLLVLATQQSARATLPPVGPFFTVKFSLAERQFVLLKLSRPSGINGIERTRYSILEALYHVSNMVRRAEIEFFNHVIVPHINRTVAAFVTGVDFACVAAVKFKLHIEFLCQFFYRAHCVAAKWTFAAIVPPMRVIVIPFVFGLARSAVSKRTSGNIAKHLTAGTLFYAGWWYPALTTFIALMASAVVYAAVGALSLGVPFSRFLGQILGGAVAIGARAAMWWVVGAFCFTVVGIWYGPYH